MPKSERVTLRPVAQESIADKKFKRVSPAALRIQPTKVHPSIVLADLKQGSLKSSARYIRQTGGISDAAVARALVRLIDGSARVSSHRIFVADHPDRTRAKGGRPKSDKRSPPSEDDQRLVALFEEMLPIEKKSEFAVSAAAVRAGVKKSKVWRARRKCEQYKQIVAEEAVAAAKTADLNTRRENALASLRKRAVD